MKKALFLAALLAASICAQAATLKVEVWQGDGPSSLSLTDSFEMEIPEEGRTTETSPRPGIHLLVSGPEDAGESQRYYFVFKLATVVNSSEFKGPEIKGPRNSLSLPKVINQSIRGEADFALSDRFEANSTPETRSTFNFAPPEPTDKEVPPHLRVVFTRVP